MLISIYLSICMCVCVCVCVCMYVHRASPMVKNPSAMQETYETWVQPLSWKNPWEEAMATHSSILVWRISWTEQPGGLQSIGLQRADVTEATEHTYIFVYAYVKIYI